MLWAIMLLLLVSPGADAEAVRYVPQLGLTYLSPSRIAISPLDPDLLMVVNDTGRIDLINIGNPDLPVKTAELWAGAGDAAFSPDGSRIVVGGSDGRLGFWDLWGRALTDPIKAHSDPIWSVAFSPTGTHVATGGEDGTIRLWTSESAAVAEIEAHSDIVRSIAFSPDGTRLVSGGEDGAVRLWELSGTLVAEARDGHEGRVWSVAYSPDGQRFASGGQDGRVRIWSLDGEPAIEPLRGHEGSVRSIAFSADGAQLASGGNDETVRFWTLGGQLGTVTVEGDDLGVIVSVAFTPDGTVVSVGDDGAIHFWKPGLVRVEEGCPSHRERVRSVGFLPDGKTVVSGGDDGTVRLWDLEGLPLVEPLAGHEGAVAVVAVSPDGGTIASGGADGRILLWSVAGRRAFGIFEAHKGWVYAAAFSSDGRRLVTGGADGAIRLWDRKGKLLTEVLDAHDKEDVLSLDFSPDGNGFVSGGEDSTLRLWASDGRPLGAPLQGHGGRVRSVVFAPGGRRIASGADDGTIRLWSSEGASIGQPIEGHGDWVRGVAFAPDGQSIASGADDGTLRLWSLSGKPLAEPRPHPSGLRVLSVAFSSDGKHLVTGASDGAVRLWTTALETVGEPFEGHLSDTWGFDSNGSQAVVGRMDGSICYWDFEKEEQSAGSFQGHRGAIWDVALSPDGTRIASVGDWGEVRLWTPDGEFAGAPLEGHDGRILSVAFSPDGRRVAAGGGDGTVRLWNVGGDLQGSLLGQHGEAVTYLAFSPDGRTVVTGATDGVLRLWTTGGQSIGEPMQAHDSWVSGISFSPDGTRLATTGFDRSVRLWKVGSGLEEASQEEPDEGWISAAFSLDGLEILSAGVEGAVQILNAEGLQVARLSTEDKDWVGARYARDEGRVVMAAYGGTIHLYSFQPTPVREPLKGRRDSAWATAVTLEGPTIAVAELDGTVAAWTLDSEDVETYHGHDDLDLAFDLAFSPDGSRIASVGLGIRVWERGGTPIDLSTAFPTEWWLVSFSPDGRALLGGGLDGRVGIWRMDRIGISAPVIFESGSEVVTAASFSPDGGRVVTAGGEGDGKLRFWTAEGSLAGESSVVPGGIAAFAFSPDGTRIGVAGNGVRFLTSEGGALGPAFGDHGTTAVAFSPDGQRVVSGDQSGALTLWSLEGEPVAGPIRLSSAISSIHWLNPAVLFAPTQDRIHVLDENLQPRGQIFLRPQGWMAILKSGVYAPTDHLHLQVRAVDDDGSVVTERGAVPAIDFGRAQEILFDDYSTWGRIRASASALVFWGKARYDALGWFRVLFWPALGWLLVASTVLISWAAAPHRLARWAMPLRDAPRLPTWRWLTEVVTLVGYLGSTHRAARSWLRQHHGTLRKQNFTGRRPVRERERYSDVGHAARIVEVAERIARRQPVRLWIHGPGGTGKSALAYAILRRATEDGPARPVPVLVDEDWGEDLLGHVARLVRPEDDSRMPTQLVVGILAARGDVCLLVDSLSERRMEDAAEHVATLVRDDLVRAVVVTSRQPPPEGRVWETFQQVETRPLARDQVPLYVATYAPEDQRATVQKRLAPLLASGEPLSPLYLRFAIERALEGDLRETSRQALVLDYLERLRAGRIDLGRDDMVRACRIAAIECLRDSPTPREISTLQLRTALQVKADELPFLDEAGEAEVRAEPLVNRLLESGVMTRNQANDLFVQFTYDPVAEELKKLQLDGR